jgi:hypothetical protein
MAIDRPEVRIRVLPYEVFEVERKVSVEQTASPRIDVASSLMSVRFGLRHTVWLTNKGK